MIALHVRVWLTSPSAAWAAVTFGTLVALAVVVHTTGVELTAAALGVLFCAVSLASPWRRST